MKTVQLGSYIKIAAIISSAVGLLVIIGWVTGNENLKSVVAGLATMKFNTAVCFMLCGIALFLLVKNGGSTRYYQIIILLIVVLIGLVSFCQYIFNFNSGLDELFIKDPGTAVAHFPGRMAASTAFCFLLLSLSSIAILLAGNSIKRTAQYALHFISLVAFVALIGYLYDIPSFYKLSFFQSMALSTSVLFFILSIAVSLLNNSYGIVKLFTGNSTSSIMAKKLFPLFAIIILVLGFVRLELHHLNIVSEDFGIALFATSSIIVCLVLTTITAKYLDKIDAKRTAAEESLRSLNMNLTTAIESQEKERKHIGFELNENVNQILTAANMHLGLIKRGENIPSPELIDETSILIKKAIEGIDKITRNIGSSYIEDIGLTEALNDLAYKMNALYIFKVELRLFIEGVHIPPPVELTIYRFVQEQLNNILKFAEASQVIIQLHRNEDLLVLEISDNGKGADLEEIKKGTALSIMRNRIKAYNGKVEFDTSPGKGFKVVVKLPYKQPEK